MMRTAAASAPWRLRLRDHCHRKVLGAGFQIAPGLALTCEHVIAKQQAGCVWADYGDPVVPSTPTHRSTLAGPGAASADVAVLHLGEPAHDIPSAPIGPAEPPPPGTALLAFGFPSMPPQLDRATAGDQPADPGFWAQVVVDGFGMQAGQVQLTSAAPHGMPVRQRFSGGPVVDPESGLVVGMVAQVWEAQRTAFMITVAALAGACPQLRDILLPRVSADPGFSRGMSALESGNYPAALDCFRAVCARRPEDPAIWYYLVLAAGGGKRPRAHSTGYARELGHLLAEAAALRPREPHVLALWALLKEDHHRARGISEGTPTLAELRQAIPDVSAEHAAEICRHMPAPEATVWQELNRRRTR
jgi:hypothetical protein